MSEAPQWPSLPLNEWQDTYRTLHMWTQIVGKIRMTLTPPLNHWWHVTLYVNSRGLTTGPVPYPRGVFEIQLDFENQALQIHSSEGKGISRPLCAESVAAFYGRVMESLAYLGIEVKINLFRGQFIGKCSPVHFFWGSCDLACTRFSGRLAPPRKGVISGPAYSHEVCSAGFWPGGGAVDGPAYYSYAVPQPAGIEQSPRWSPKLSEFLLMYDEVRQAASPEETLYAFLQNTYAACATLGKWDRAALEP
jgi:hypothetical protein